MKKEKLVRKNNLNDDFKRGYEQATADVQGYIDDMADLFSNFQA